MNRINNIRELFIDQLQDRYSAALQQAEAFEKLHAACTHSDLREVLKNDIDANKDHLQHLKTILEEFNANPEGEYCEGTAGLVKEAIDTLDIFEKGDVLDIAIAISVQHINHHDIAGYNGCKILARYLRLTEVHKTVVEMLNDEEKTDALLSGFIDRVVSE